MTDQHWKKRRRQFVRNMQIRQGYNAQTYRNHNIWLGIFLAVILCGFLAFVYLMGSLS